MELHQAIFQFYLPQIQFGFYEHWEKLPSLEETCRQFHTSLDTAIPVYHRLGHEGYITLAKKAGEKVTVPMVRKRLNAIYSPFTLSVRNP